VRQPFARWRAAASLAAAAVAAAGLTLSGPAQHALATTVTQADPFPVGNLLNYANSDIESAGFNWAADLNQAGNDVASIGQDATTSLLHAHSLAIVASGAGPLVYKLGNGQDGTSAAITLPEAGGAYRVGAYLEVPAGASQHTVEFDLACYDAAGQWLGWVTGTPVAMIAGGGWQYVEDDFLADSNPLPAACAQVQGSPRVEVTGMSAGGTVHMDDVIFAPYRAALAIGAHGSAADKAGYSAQDWLSANATTGPLQTDKEFFGGNLPSTTVNGQTPFEQTVCSGIDQGLPARQAFPACILAYKGSMTQADMNNFLQSVPPGQQLYLVYWQEAEGSYSGTPQQFVRAFQANAQLVHSSPYDTPNIFVAQDSAGSAYKTDPAAQACDWIVPASNANGPDVYLVDHYENGTVNGGDVNHAANAIEWQDWLWCASQYGRPLGFGEYGLDNSPVHPSDVPASQCMNGPAPPMTTNAENLPKALLADNGYLEQLPMSGDLNLRSPAPFVVWSYWYSDYGGTKDCTVFNNKYGAIDEWRSIETQNGGD
jgi:hypothetical protein